MEWAKGKDSEQGDRKVGASESKVGRTTRTDRESGGRGTAEAEALSQRGFV